MKINLGHHGSSLWFPDLQAGKDRERELLITAECRPPNEKKINIFNYIAKARREQSFNLLHGLTD